MSDEVSYRGSDGVWRWLPLLQGDRVVVPREVVAREPALVWCTEHQDADLLSSGVRERLLAIEVAGAPVDPDQGAFVVPLGEWLARAGARLAAPAEPDRRPSAPAGVVPLEALAGMPQPPGGGALRYRGDASKHGRGRRFARGLGALWREALDATRAAGVVDGACWVGQLLLAAFNLIMCWATLGWAREAWGSTATADGLHGVLLAAVALLVGATARRLRPKRRTVMAPATLADACGLVCLAALALVLAPSVLNLA